MRQNYYERMIDFKNLQEYAKACHPEMKKRLETP